MARQHPEGPAVEYQADDLKPFGTPDGSRAEIKRIIGEFVDFDGDAAFGALATRADDSMVRVIVGKLGAGKTVYMRRLHAHQAGKESVYAVAPEQDPPDTEAVVKACQWFSGPVLVEKWMQIWSRAILRTVVSHLLLAEELRSRIPEHLRGDLSRNYARLLGDFRRPRSIYKQVRAIIDQHDTAFQLTRFLSDPLWDDLEDVVAEAIGHCRPMYFYLDGADESFGRAPMYWLRCQEGLFYHVMRLLRDHRFGGRLHIVIAVRDIVMSSVLRSEHAPRYRGEPHIRTLSWDRSSLRYLLDSKVRRLPPGLRMRRPVDEPTVRDWLGLTSVLNERGQRERIDDFLLRHTRMIPRDVVSLGNALAEEVLRQKRAGRERIPDADLKRVVGREAKSFGDSQLAQCANQVTSDLMPPGAASANYSEFYTSTEAYISDVLERMRGYLRMIGATRFPRSDLETLRGLANPEFDDATDVGSVLWLNGLLGYVDPRGQDAFYTLGEVEDFHLPPDVDTYVLHPCLAGSVGLDAATGLPADR